MPRLSSASGLQKSCMKKSATMSILTAAVGTHMPNRPGDMRAVQRLFNKYSYLTRIIW